MAEMENVSFVPLKQPIVFTLEGFTVEGFTRQQGYSLFAVTLIVYSVMLLGNITVVTVIATDAKLHKPMYVLMCNLAACDLLGGTVGYTQLMIEFLAENNTIGYVAAIVQAICVHFYGVAFITLISVMAYDRYVAICKPLHYHNIMTTGRLVTLCVLAWFFAVCLITPLFIMNVMTPLCGTYIKYIISTNGAILSVSCIPTPINGLYFLCSAWLYTLCSFVVINFTYVKILITCVIKQEKSSRSKALQTCVSHLTVCILFELSTLVLVSFNLKGVSSYGSKFCMIMYIVMPPTLNPLIYGIAMKDIRTNIVRFFKSC